MKVLNLFNLSSLILFLIPLVHSSCGSGCKPSNCSGSSCSECYSNYTLYDQKCYHKCSEGQAFLMDKNSCNKTTFSNCLIYYSDYCLQCKEGNFLSYPSCQSCSSNCLRCSSKAVCFQCGPGFKLETQDSGQVICVDPWDEIKRVYLPIVIGVVASLIFLIVLIIIIKKVKAYNKRAKIIKKLIYAGDQLKENGIAGKEVSVKGQLKRPSIFVSKEESPRKQPGSPLAFTSMSTNVQNSARTFDTLKVPVNRYGQSSPDEKVSGLSNRNGSAIKVLSLRVPQADEVKDAKLNVKEEKENNHGDISEILEDNTKENKHEDLEASFGKKEKENNEHKILINTLFVPDPQTAPSNREIKLYSPKKNEQNQPMSPKKDSNQNYHRLEDSDENIDKDISPTLNLQMKNYKNSKKDSDDNLDDKSHNVRNDYIDSAELPDSYKFDDLVSEERRISSRIRHD